jgi:hypothetical protein
MTNNFMVDCELPKGFPINLNLWTPCKFHLEQNVSANWDDPPRFEWSRVKRSQRWQSFHCTMSFPTLDSQYLCRSTQTTLDREHNKHIFQELRYTNLIAWYLQNTQRHAVPTILLTGSLVIEVPTPVKSGDIMTNHHLSDVMTSRR